MFFKQFFKSRPDPNDGDLQKQIKINNLMLLRIEELESVITSQMTAITNLSSHLSVTMRYLDVLLYLLFDSKIISKDDYVHLLNNSQETATSISPKSVNDIIVAEIIKPITNITPAEKFELESIIKQIRISKIGEA